MVMYCSAPILTAPVNDMGLFIWYPLKYRGRLDRGFILARAYGGLLFKGIAWRTYARGLIKGSVNNIAYLLVRVLVWHAALLNEKSLIVVSHIVVSYTPL